LRTPLFDLWAAKDRSVTLVRGVWGVGDLFYSLKGPVPFFRSLVRSHSRRVDGRFGCLCGVYAPFRMFDGCGVLRRDPAGSRP